MEGLSLYDIDFNAYFISFNYRDDSKNTNAVFIWGQTTDPTTWIYARPGGVAKAAHELNHNGVEYILTELAEPDGLHLKWVRDGKAFVVITGPEYSVEELLDFSDYETVFVDAMESSEP